ncbi:MAG: hypothetical protein HYX72_00450 [Acidobacteria bacterium]|nr:hypothetical protein [Acidobacteriota bacterium]
MLHSWKLASVGCLLIAAPLFAQSTKPVTIPYVIPDAPSGTERIPKFRTPSNQNEVVSFDRMTTFAD